MKMRKKIQQKSILMLALFALCIWSSPTLGRRNKKVSMKNLRDYASQASKATSSEAPFPVTASNKLVLLRKKKHTLEESLDHTSNEIDALHDQIPQLKNNRLNTLERIGKITQRMTSEKQAISQAIRHQASLYRKLRNIQKNRDEAVARAKIQYLNNYGVAANPRGNNSYRHTLEKIKRYEAEIGVLQHQLTSLAPSNAPDINL